MHLIILACIAALATARPSFIAVPADQIAFLDLSNIHVRVPRQTLSPPPPPPQLPQAFYDEEYQPVALPQYQQQPIGLAPTSEQQLLQQPIRVANLQSQQQQQHQHHQQQHQHHQQQQEIASAASPGASQRLAERPPDFGEYVDFGAHTGDNGAFGWYADYPINQYSDHSRY